MGTDRPFPRRHSDLRPSSPWGEQVSLSPALGWLTLRHEHFKKKKSRTNPLSRSIGSEGAAQHSPPYPCEVTASSDERKTEVNCKWASMAGHGAVPKQPPSHLIAQRLQPVLQHRAIISVHGLQLLNLQKRAWAGALRTRPSLEQRALGKGRRESGEGEEEEGGLAADQDACGKTGETGFEEVGSSAANLWEWYEAPW